MRTSVGFASILLLLAATAHGIRLDRQFQEAINSKQKMVVSPTSGEASIARSVNKHCSPDGHCASSGTVRKRLTHAESGAAKQMQGSAGNGHSKTDVDADAAKTTSQQGRHDAEAPGDRSVYQEEAAAAATPRQRQRQTTTYPDIMDIAGMDYSPATRRSPIHN